jgi:hypothetical protein
MGKPPDSNSDSELPAGDLASEGPQNSVVAEHEADVDWRIIDLLTNPRELRHWSLEELSLEIGDETDTVDGVRRLHTVGLVHRTSDGFVFATRAAVRYREITP